MFRDVWRMVMISTLTLMNGDVGVLTPQGADRD